MSLCRTALQSLRNLTSCDACLFSLTSRGLVREQRYREPHVATGAPLSQFVLYIRFDSCRKNININLWKLTFPFRVSPQRINCLHLFLSTASSSFTPTTSISSLCLSHSIYKPPLRCSSYPLAWQLHPQHAFPDILSISPRHISKQTRSCPDFVSKHNFKKSYRPQILQPGNKGISQKSSQEA